MARKLVLLLGVVLVLGAAATWLLAGRNGGSRPSEPGNTPPASIATVLPELSAFVERARGRQFLEDVRIRVLSEPLFREELKRFSPDPDQVGRAETVLEVLGLLQPETDLRALLAASDQRTVGFYDPARNELVTGNELTPLLRRVAVHELTHALDDQHFGIDRNIQGDEAAIAFQALVEGSAIRVERLYVEPLPPAQQRQIAAEERLVKGQTQLPPAVEQLLGFPYVFGPPFVEALVDAGPDRLDGAFSAPPASTEQVLEPSRYLTADAPRTVGPPQAEGAVIDEGEVGPVVLRLLLESKLDQPQAREAATGWDGDRYVTWRSPDGRTCIRIQFAVDTPEDSRQLQDALAQWVSRVADREVDSAGLLLKACERSG